MDFKSEIGTRSYNVLVKKNITNFEQAVRIFPRKYYDFTQTVPLIARNCGEMRAFSCRLISFDKQEKNKRIIVKAKMEEEETGTKLYISWFGQYFMYKHLKDDFFQGERVLVCGKATYIPQYRNFFMQNPIIFTRFNPNRLCIYKVYPHYSGISDDGLNGIINVSIMRSMEQDMLPDHVRNAYGLPLITDAIYTLHHPLSFSDIQKAKNRLAIEDMLYFAVKLEEEAKRITGMSQYTIQSTKLAEKITNMLPYALTDDQKRVYEEIVTDMKKGNRVNALVQGDVGCGKTIVAFLLMAAAASNGYQSLLFAPTSVLAGQHYRELSAMMEALGQKVVYLEGGMKAKDKKQILEMIEDGTADMVVGTHSILQPGVKFKNLALAVIDEEHKFGVIQRRTVSEKAQNGVHTVTMSATPIPRTLAASMFSNKKIHNITTMPAGRKPVQTILCDDQEEIDNFIFQELKKGRQAYVVCPLISDEDTKLMTVEDTYKMYAKQFGKENVALLHGKVKAEETEEILKGFMSGKVKILISTTVVEVGVNNPNASVMVINNAERFGLAGLHQLRGRIGRGEYQGLCILNSEDTENERLNALCRCSNGFEIAEEDLRLRGVGNPIGTEQSGYNKLVETSLKYPNVFRQMRKVAAEMVRSGDDKIFVDNYEAIHGE